jgi:UDP-N-acetyl-D-mannosaminuronate dehydrogenase
MHICYSFHIEEFIGQSIAYIQKYRPGLTIVNSTVAPGTTRAIYEATGAPIVHSPVRGKHFKMKQELLHYSKFVGGINSEYSRMAASHFERLGMKTKILASPEATELGKLTETTYFGVMIAWAQEVERYCDELLLDYDEVVSFYEEIGFFPPVKYFPGVIGGHCVMPNIEILKTVFHSDILDAIEKSNQLRIQRDAHHNS